MPVFASATDKESGVVDMYFYLGKPVDGKMPPGTVKVPGTQPRPDDVPEDWTAAFQVPPDAKGTFEVTVVAINGAGLSSTKTLVLPVTDPPPTAASISGRVFELDEPKDNVPVVLLNADGEEV